MKIDTNVAETLYYKYSQSDEFYDAVSEKDWEYSSIYKRLAESLDSNTCEELESTVAANCNNYGLVGFKLGMSVAFNLKADLEKSFGSAFGAGVEKDGVV